MPKHKDYNLMFLPHSVMLVMNWSKSLQTKASPRHPLPVAHSKSPPSQGTGQEVNKIPYKTSNKYQD